MIVQQTFSQLYRKILHNEELFKKEIFNPEAEMSRSGKVKNDRENKEKLLWTQITLKQ